MGPLVLIVTILTFATAHGYELSCGLQFSTVLPQQECTLRNVTQYDLDAFGVAGIPQGALLEVLNPEINRFDEAAFIVISKARDLTFKNGIVKNIVFQSDSLVSLRVWNSWIVNFEVAEEDNFSLKTLSIKSDKFRIISPTIRYLKGLREVRFQKCSLEFIDFNLFGEMANLQFLDLSSNKIHSVRTSPSVPLPALKSLDISNNNLAEIQNFPGVFPSLKLVHLRKNAWYCDWVGEARGNIWNAGITVTGAESFCGGKDMTSNGGLCCKERPKEHVVHTIFREIVEAIQAPVLNNTPNMVVLVNEESNEPSVMVYNLV